MNKIIVDIKDDNVKEVLYELAIKQFGNLRRLKLNKGHSLFKYDIRDGYIIKVEYSFDFYRNLVFNHEVGCIYLTTLNMKNAYKKYSNIIRYADVLARIKESAKTDSPTPLDLIKGDEKIEEIKSDVTDLPGINGSVFELELPKDAFNNNVIP